jgi:hypothetical protein
MTDDIVARLRTPYWSCTTNMMIIHPIQGEAADEIERLRAVIQRLEWEIRENEDARYD